MRLLIERVKSVPRVSEGIMAVYTASQVRRAKRRRNKNNCSKLRAVAAAFREQRQIRSQAALSAYLRDEGVKQEAMERALEKLGAKRTLPLSQSRSNIDLYRRNPNAAFHWNARKSGGHRAIFKFSSEEIAAQIIMRDVLTALYSRPVWQYDQKHRGRDVCIQEMKQLVAAGCHFYCSLDIRDCYQSFLGDRIASILRLPEGLVRTNLLVDGLIDSVGHKTPSLCRPTNLQPLQLGGLPQGSITSSLVVGLLLADLHEVLPPWVTIFAYADDIVCLADNKASIDETKRALVDGLQNHRSGCLRLKRLDCGSLQETGLDFLGYRLSMDGSAVLVDLSQSNQDQLFFEFANAVREDQHYVDDSVPAVRRLVVRRSQGFRMLNTPTFDGLIAIAKELVWQEQQVCGVPRVLDEQLEQVVRRLQNTIRCPQKVAQ